MSRKLSQKRLDFSGQVKKPFSGKVFYLDLNGHPRHNYVVQNLQALGATVSEFLSREENIDYIVTAERRKESSRHDSGKSSATLRSPFSIATQSGDSPSPHSCDLGTVPAPSAYTRGAEMLQKAARGWGAAKKVAYDIEAKAQDWHIKIITLEQALADIDKHRHLLEHPQPAQYQRLVTNRKPPGRSNSHQVHKLIAPFIKVEDMSRQYRPLFSEMTCWPQPDFSSELGTCPFGSPPRGIVPIQQSSRIRVKPLLHSADRLSKTTSSKPSSHLQSDGRKIPTASRPGRPVAGGWKRKGHCECCGMKFDCLNTHLESAQHCLFANETANYSHLDELIESLSLDLSTFLKSRKAVFKEAAMSPNSTVSKSASHKAIASSPEEKNLINENCATLKETQPSTTCLDHRSGKKSDTKSLDEAVESEISAQKTAQPCTNGVENCTAAESALASLPSVQTVLDSLPLEIGTDSTANVSKHAQRTSCSEGLTVSNPDKPDDGNQSGLDESFVKAADVSLSEIQSPRRCRRRVAAKNNTSVEISSETVKTVSETASGCCQTAAPVSHNGSVSDRHGDPCENTSGSQQSVQRRGWFSQTKTPPTASTGQRIKLQRNFLPREDTICKDVRSVSSMSESDHSTQQDKAPQTPTRQRPLTRQQTSPRMPRRSLRSPSSKSPASPASARHLPGSQRAGLLYSSPHRSSPKKPGWKTASPSRSQNTCAARSVSKRASPSSPESDGSVKLIKMIDSPSRNSTSVAARSKARSKLSRPNSPSTTPNSKSKGGGVSPASTPTLAASVRKPSNPFTPKENKCSDQHTINGQKQHTPRRPRRRLSECQEHSLVVIDNDVHVPVSPVNVEAWVQNPALPGAHLYSQIATPTKRRLHMHDLISVNDDEDSSVEAFSSPFPFSKEKLNRVLTHLPVTPTDKSTPSKRRLRTEGAASMPVSRQLCLVKDSPVTPNCSRLFLEKVRDGDSMDDFDLTPCRKRSKAPLAEMSKEEPLPTSSRSCFKKRTKSPGGKSKGHADGVPPPKRKCETTTPPNIKQTKVSSSVIIVQDSDSSSSVQTAGDSYSIREETARPRISLKDKRSPPIRRKRSRSMPVRCTAVSRLEASGAAPFARLHNESSVSNSQSAEVFDFVDEPYLSQKETDEFGMVDSYYY